MMYISDMVNGKEYIFNGSHAFTLRLYAGMTQKQVAEMMGVSSSTISRFEHGKGNMNQTQITKYAQAIGCHPGAFWTEIGTTDSPF